MLGARDGLSLPLDNHNYLRAVVYGLADKADAKAEYGREVTARTRTSSGPSPATPGESRLDAQLRWLRQQFERGQITDLQHQEAVADAKEKLGLGT